MTYRLTVLLYLFALVSAALTAFGAWGILAAIGVSLFWAAIFQRRELGYLNLGVVFGTILVVIALLASPVEMAREAARHNQCLGHMKQLSLSILYYHVTNGSFPPPTVIRGKNDDSHSWRIEVLPFMEANGIYQAYRFDEPWNGQNNIKITTSWWGPNFDCPTHGQASETNYFAVVGPHTAWGDGEPRSFRDITDGTRKTILLIEASGRGVDWKEPRDLTFQEAVDLLSSPIHPPGSDGHVVDHGYFYKPHVVRNVAMCDGSCRRLHMPIERDLAIALLTANGGEKIDLDDIERLGEPELDYGVIYAFTLFVLLALVPGVPKLRPWVWPTRARERCSAE